jgi:hypothetical protein
MSRCRFEKSDIVRLPLADEDWIEVKHRLSGGELRRMSAAAFRDVQQTAVPGDSPRIGVDFGTLSLARTKAYLKDWSFRDKDDKPVKVTPEAVEALDDETLKEIEKALDAHILSVEAEVKARSGEPASSQV